MRWRPADGIRQETDVRPTAESLPQFSGHGFRRGLPGIR